MNIILIPFLSKANHSSIIVIMFEMTGAVMNQDNDEPLQGAKCSRVGALGKRRCLSSNV